MNYLLKQRLKLLWISFGIMFAAFTIIGAVVYWAIVG